MASVSGIPPCWYLFFLSYALSLVKVGQYEYSVPRVISTDGGSRYAVPLQVIPARGHLCGDSTESSNKQSWEVFHEHESRSNFANDSHELKKESASFPFESRPPAGDTDILARESTSDDIHASSPGSPVECRDVPPDRGIVKQAVSHSCLEDFDAVVVPFDVTDRSERQPSPLKGSPKPEANSADSGK